MDHGICWQDVGVLVPEMGDQQGQRHEDCAQQPLDFEKASRADHKHSSIHIVLRVDFIDCCQQAADGKRHDPRQHKFFLQKNAEIKGEKKYHSQPDLRDCKLLVLIEQGMHAFLSC